MFADLDELPTGPCLCCDQPATDIEECDFCSQRGVELVSHEGSRLHVRCLLFRVGLWGVATNEHAMMRARACCVGPLRLFRLRAIGEKEHARVAAMCLLGSSAEVDHVDAFYEVSIVVNGRRVIAAVGESWQEVLARAKTWKENRA